MFFCRLHTFKKCQGSGVCPFWNRASGNKGAPVGLELAYHKTSFQKLFYNRCASYRECTIRTFGKATHPYGKPDVSWNARRTFFCKIHSQQACRSCCLNRQQFNAVYTHYNPAAKCGPGRQYLRPDFKQDERVRSAYCFINSYDSRTNRITSPSKSSIE